MPKDAALIQTKIHSPTPQAGIVSRERLRNQLIHGLQGPFTLISAPAGFGKSTLAASSTAFVKMPIAWLSLDKNDNQLMRFVYYFIAALQEVDDSLGAEIIRQITGTQDISTEFFISALINDLEDLDDEIGLIIDDYQFINHQAIHDVLSSLIEHCPANFHLVICTRSDPPFPLARLRSHNRMVEIRAADLSFTNEEAVQFLNDIMGLNLDSRIVEILEARTEGWVAGLQMAALSMRGRKDVNAFVEAFAGTNRFIMDFMMEEVLSHETEAVQEFLLRTAILNRLNGDLCQIVSDIPDGQAMLETLEKRNLFVISLDDDRTWYRYHHLFADLLQARLQQSDSALMHQLYLRASVWSEQAGQVNDAVEYAIASQDYDRVTHLIEAYWQQSVNSGEIESVCSWLEAIPKEVVRKSVLLGVTFCWVYWLRGQIRLIEPHLADAEQVWKDLQNSKGFIGNDPAYAQVPASLAALRSFVARYQSEYETAIRYGKQALNLLPDNFPEQVNAQLKSMILISLASSYDGAGRLIDAVDAYTEVIRLSRQAGNIGGVTGITYRLVGALRMLGKLGAANAACQDAFDYLQAQGMDELSEAGILHIAISEVLLEWNDLEAAESHLAKGLALGKWGGRLDASRNAAPALARLRQIRRDLNGALSAVQEAEASLGRSPSPLALAELIAIRTIVFIRQGLLTEALTCLNQASSLAGKDNGQTGAMVNLAAYRLLLAQNKVEEGINQLTDAIMTADKSGWMGMLVELYILRSLAYLRQNNYNAAETDLNYALVLAEPEGYVRIFLDEEQPMQTLLTRWSTHHQDSPFVDTVSRILKQFTAEADFTKISQDEPDPQDIRKRSNQSLIDPLSERELEVLDLMALGMTNKQIAMELFVAAGTIKAHAASIYRKLDAANRTEAIARARHLNILS